MVPDDVERLVPRNRGAKKKKSSVLKRETEIAK